jgi:hypothetical protein
MHPLIDDAAWLQNRLRWRMLPNFTIRNGDMKLSMIEREADGVLRAFLFDLAKDPGETSNLAEGPGFSRDRQQMLQSQQAPTMPHAQSWLTGMANSRSPIR